MGMSDEQKINAGRVKALLISMGCTTKETGQLNPFLSDDSGDVAIRLESFLGSRLRVSAATLTPRELLLVLEGAAIADRMSACPACGRRKNVD